MSENTKIEWADHTFNPWEGCQKVGPGCDNCYAETRNARFAGGVAVNWGPSAPRRRTSESNWKLPLKWNKQAAAEGRRFRVFCSSLADVFDNAVPVQWRIELMRLIVDTPHLDWLLLTKRIGNAAEMLDTAFRAVHAGREGWADNVLPNVWIGATVVNQAEADRDVRKLLATPASVRFLSIEPMLGPINLKEIAISGSGHHEFDPIIIADVLRPWVNRSRIDWVICGGESGPNARPMHPQWARNLRDQCAAAGVPFMHKQWGEWKPISEMTGNESDTLYRSARLAMPHEDQGNINDLYGRVCKVDTDGIGFGGARGRDAFFMVDGECGYQTFKVGKKAAGRLLDGVTHDGIPAPKNGGAA